MSDFFFESAEPSLDEFSMEDFLDRFPEGNYEFETRTIEGNEQDGEAMFTHTIPAGPVITGPRRATSSTRRPGRRLGAGDDDDVVQPAAGTRHHRAAIRSS